MLLVFFCLLLSVHSFGQSMMELKAEIKTNQIGSISDSIDVSKIIFHERELNYAVMYSVGGVVLATTTSIYIYQRNAWWSTNRSKFHFMNDWDYALWMDKVGHFYDGILVQHGVSSAFEAANFDYEKCVLYGAVGSFLFMTYVEIEDGFGSNWGFSPGDGIANTLGALYPVAQYYYPYLKNFQFKFSYYPDKLHKEGLIANQQHIIFDDYEGQKFWLSARMKEILPKNISKYWPEYLMLALGSGVKNLDGHGRGDRNYYIALDFDFETLPLHGQWWQFVKNTLNFLHLPMPGVRINNNVAFFGFLF